MRSFLTASWPSSRLWEISYLLIAVYLLFHPVLDHPQSAAVVLGGGLALLLIRAIPSGALAELGFLGTCFLVYALLSSFLSILPGLTLQSAGFLFLGLLLYFQARQNEPSVHRRVEHFVILFAVAAALLALHQKFYGFSEMAFLPVHLAGEEAKIVAAAVHDQRAFGPLATSGSLAALLIFCIPQALVRAWTAVRVKRLLFSGALLILLAGLWATGSVGAWCCLALALLMLVWKQGSRWEALILLLLGLIVALGVVWGRGFHSWTQASYSMRLELWRSAWELFLRNPVLGSGLGTFGEAYQNAGLNLGTGSLFAHNILLQLLVETGLVGTLLFFLGLFGVLRRFKWPALWEGWGVLGGLLAVFFFSFLDLPFQMPELVWVFAGVAGRLELKPEKTLKTKEIPVQWLSWSLLAVFAVTGFWPPYRAWNFALLAIPLWVLVGYAKAKWDKMPLWVFLGVLYFALRAFCSPSAIGTVWFFEAVGVLLVFYLLLTRFLEKEKFINFFLFLGLLWGVKIWIGDYQTFFANPKHLALFLVPLVFLFWMKKRTLATWIGLSFALLTILRLRSYGALVALATGSLALVRKRRGFWIAVGLLVILGAVVALRTFDTSSTKWERLSIWSSALKVWEPSPIMGVGPGAFEGLYHHVKEPRTSGVSRYLMDARYAHNEYLELLTAFGVVGVLFVLAFLIFLRPYGDDARKRPAVVGLATGSFFDFCLHTPLVALEAIGLMTLSSGKREKPSCSGALLVLGVVLGLFGSAALVPRMLGSADSLKTAGRYPEAFRKYETAVKLNAWDAKVASARTGFLEDLFLATKDPTWKRKADEAATDVMSLEQADGQFKLENARRLTHRFDKGLEDRFAPILLAYAETRQALPLDAFAYFESAVFLVKAEHWRGPRAHWSDPEMEHWLLGDALAEYTKAVELEPNFASAWANLGLSRVEYARVLNKPAERLEGRKDLRKALEVYEQFKNVDGLAPAERQLVGLPPEALTAIKKELAR